MKGDVQPADDSGQHVLKSVQRLSYRLYRRDGLGALCPLRCFLI